MFDIIIKNGIIIDGTGRLMYRADVGIREDKIAKIGNLSDEKWEIEINADGRFVCPGFIDINNHSDTYWRIFSNPDLESLIYQGITTIVGGNCGASLAPLASPDMIDSIQKWSDIKQINVNWLDMEEFFAVLDKKRMSVNFATLVGHGTLRRGILGNQMKSPSPKEMAFIEKMLKKSLKEGALGMSSGLVYTHARTTSRDELVRLAKIIKKYDGVCVTHIREEREKFIEAVEEAITVAEDSGTRMHISHLKVMGQKNWHLMDEALFLIGRAKERGVEITFDVYPYTNTGTVLYTLLPNWATDGGRKMMLNRLRDPKTKNRLAQEMKASGFDYAKIEIAISPLNKTLARRKIADIAISQGKSVEDAIIDILVASEGRVIVSLEVLSQENVDKAVSHPLGIIATNGAGYNLEHCKSGELVHPRSFGTFPKVLSDYVLGKRILSWEEAIRKMTALPAEKCALEKRGSLVEGNFADVVVFNRDEIEDLATVDNPYQYSKGIDFVLVNGQITLSQGKYTGGKNGRIIKK